MNNGNKKINLNLFVSVLREAHGAAAAAAEPSPARVLQGSTAAVGGPGRVGHKQHWTLLMNI